MFESNQQRLRQKLGESGIDVAIITDEDSVYYFSGYFDYLHMDFGRPTLLVIPRDGASLLITPSLDQNSAVGQASVDRIVGWNDGLGQEWREELPSLLRGKGTVALEVDRMPAVVRRYIDTEVERDRQQDLQPLIASLRMIKSAAELRIARHAGQVASAMMNAGRAAIGAGVAEYEVALAINQAGTRKAASLLAAHYDAPEMSPNTHFLQIMASGSDIVKTHHRASNRVMQHGEPVFLCFCGMTNFHRFKLGFDRTFWIQQGPSPVHRKVYETAIASQAAALDVLGPGVSAESVHAAYAEVIQQAGYDYPFRCGRATGFSFLEDPQLVTGNATLLQPGMVFAVDGSVTVSDFRAQVGDSFIITDDGFEQITHHPKQLEDVVLTHASSEV